MRNKDNGIIYKDVSFNLNDHNKLEILEDVDATQSALLNLLFSEPGINPNIPGMGYGILSSTHVSDSDTSVYLLHDKLKKQIQTYMKDLNVIVKAVYLTSGTDILNYEFSINRKQNLKVVIKKKPSGDKDVKIYLARLLEGDIK